MVGLSMHGNRYFSVCIGLGRVGARGRLEGLGASVMNSGTFGVEFV